MHYFKLILLIFVTVNLIVIPSSWGARNHKNSRKKNFNRKSCSKLFGHKSDEIKKNRRREQADLKDLTGEGLIDGDMRADEFRAPQRKKVRAKTKAKFNINHKPNTPLAGNSPLMIKLNDIKPVLNNKNQLNENTNKILEITKMIEDNKSLQAHQLAYFFEKLTTKLAGRFYIEQKILEDGNHSWVIKDEGLAKNRSVVDLYDKLNALLLGTGYDTLSSREAKRIFYLSSRHNFKYYLESAPNLVRNYLKAFQSFRPRDITSPKVMIMIYSSLSKSNIKVPESWRRPSISWLNKNHTLIPLYSLVVMYKNMLGVGVPPSLIVESFIYKNIKVNTSKYSLGELKIMIEMMASSLVTPSVNMSATSVKPHFDALHKAIKEFDFKIEDGSAIYLFYYNAVHRLGFYKDQVIPVKLGLRNIDETALKDLSSINKDDVTSDKLNSENNTPSDLELKLDSALNRVLPDSKYSSEKVILKGLPAVDFVNFADKKIVESNGPRHDVLSFYEKDNGMIGVEVSPLRDIDIVTQEIYKKLNY